MPLDLHKTMELKAKPQVKPINQCFASGPTAKHKDWEINKLASSTIGRSHRAEVSKVKLKELITKLKQSLNIPADYHVGLLTGSATAAVECAMWSMLGHVGVDVMAFDVFSGLWVTDAEEQLKINDLNIYEAVAGSIPDISKYNPGRDLVFTWNGSTAGACIPDASWISSDRTGITICDATSAAFCFDLPWDKLDATCFSLQKGLGGEGAHGVIVLSPRAIKRLETFQPSWPIPRLLRIANNLAVNMGFFEGLTINTPSMLCVEDALTCLDWCIAKGGIKSLVRRCHDNFHVIKRWVEETPWVEFMADDISYTSPTTVVFKIMPWQNLSEEQHRANLKKIGQMLEQEGVAFDIVNHIKSAPSLRVWCGPTVEVEDIERLFPWLEWAYGEVARQS